MKLSSDPATTSRTSGCGRRRPRWTIRVSDELNVDLAPDGTVYGIELLNANEQLRAADEGRLVVVEAQGNERSLALTPEPRP